VRLEPLFNLGLGNDFTPGQRLIHNTRGFWLHGHIGSKLSFESRFYETQAIYPAYYDSIVSMLNVVPALGRPRSAFDGEGQDVPYATGALSWTPSTFFNLQLGHGRHFFGEGYRSLLWSDLATPYPFVRATTRLGRRIQYTNLYTQLQELDRSAGGGDPVLPRKYAASHYLSIKLGRRWELGLFESVVWPDRDTVTGERNFDLNYLNPVIFFRPVEFSIGSPDNVLIGLNASYQAGPATLLYGQFILDEFKSDELFAGNGWWANKYGWQLGLKAWDPFGLPGLMVRLEHNAARPYLFAHVRHRRSYTHLNQPLAHPLGANFMENIISLRYRRRRWTTMLRWTWADFGANPSDGNVGANPLVSSTTRNQDYGNEIGQGVPIEQQFWEASVAYLLNPLTNMRLELSALRRTRSIDAVDNPASNVVMLRWKTGLVNDYRNY
jgi:hypothetical protein